MEDEIRLQRGATPRLIFLPAGRNNRNSHSQFSETFFGMLYDPSHRRPILWAARCLLVVLFVCGGPIGMSPFLFAQTSQSAETAMTVGVAQSDAICARCHADVTNHYLQTPHSMGSGPALMKLIPGNFTQTASGVRYSISEQNGGAWLRYTDPLHPGFDGQHLLQYYLGSGHLGVTYLFSTDGYLFESPIAYYTHLARYDMKPGLADIGEGAPAIPIDSSCLRCHMSGVAETDSGTLNHYTGAPFRYGGVTCESCHGDTAEHVLSAGKSPVVNPAKLTPELRDSICISCHLEGDVSVEKDQGSALKYRPGDAISRYLSFFVYEHAAANGRGVSEVEQFAASHCRRASGDKMSCMSCHDPHYLPPPSERVAYYRAKCLNCHGAGEKGVAFAATHHPENLDCTACHMPRSTAENIPHVAWTDHRILARPSTAPATAMDDTHLIPIFSPQATSRDMALAMYSAAIDGHVEDGVQAYTLLTQAAVKSPGDIQVLNALGTLANMKGDSLEAGHLFSSVLQLDPKNRIAATNLAVLEARNRNLAQARALLQPVFDRNQDLSAVADNLAAIDCLLGDGDAARTTLETALRYSPGSRDIQQRLTQVSACRAHGSANALPNEQATPQR
jgi:tetratricopeptide (TPR) repeat protein